MSIVGSAASVHYDGIAFISEWAFKGPVATLSSRCTVVDEIWRKVKVIEVPCDGGSGLANVVVGGVEVEAAETDAEKRRQTSERY